MLIDMVTKNSISKQLTGQPTRDHNANTRVVTQELMNVARARVEMRDPTSSKLNIKGPVAYESMRKEDMKQWNTHLKSMPDAAMFGWSKQSGYKNFDQKHCTTRFFFASASVISYCCPPMVVVIGSLGS